MAHTRFRVTHHRIALILIPFTLAYLLSELVRNVNGVLAPYLRQDLSITAGGLGLLTAAFLGALAGSQLLVGVMLDRYGPKRVVVAMMGLAVMAALWFACASGLVQLAFARFLMGLGFCACWTGAYKANALWWPVERLPLVNAVTISLASLGSLAATWPTEAALGIVSWRWLFTGLAVTIAVFVLLIATFVPRHPREAREHETIVRHQIEGFLDVARSRIFWSVAPVSFLTQGAWIAYQGLWAGEWMRQIGGKSDKEAAMILTGLALAVVIGQFGFGLLADRVARRTEAYFRMTAGLCVAFIVVQLVLIVDPQGYAGVLWIAYGALTAGPIFGYALLTRLVPTSASGSAIALLNFFAVLCGALFQAGVGLVIETWPAGMPFTSHQAALLVAVAFQSVALIWMVRSERHVQYHEPTMGEQESGFRP